MNNNNRQCTICQHIFPATTDYFHKSNTSKCGLHSRCKLCKKLLETERRKKNPEKALLRDKFFREKYKDKIASYIKDYAQKNKKRLNEKKRKRYHNDPKYKMKQILRRRFYDVIVKKYQSYMEFGCSIEELCLYIESKFSNGMTWGNHGEWHIDHIKPCCAFDLTDPKQQKECFHYSNLQPLWAVDNLKKSGKYHQ
jgi:hypothetical protein